MKIEIPNAIVQEALEAYLIQDKWSINSTEWRSREAERRQYHFSEIVIWIIVNEYRNQKLLPYGNRKKTK